MGRLDPAAALRAGRAALETMVLGAEVGSPKVKVTVKLPVGTGPEPPSADERVLAAAPGTSPQQRVAREKVMHDFYQNRIGLGAPRCTTDLKSMNLDQPVQVIQLVPPTVIRASPPFGASAVGNIFEADEAPKTEAQGAGNTEGSGAELEVTDNLDAFAFFTVEGRRVLVIDDAARDHRLRKRQPSMPESQSGSWR